MSTYPSRLPISRNPSQYVSVYRRGIALVELQLAFRPARDMYWQFCIYSKDLCFCVRISLGRKGKGGLLIERDGSR